MKYETVIGLEVHVELATKSKIFCSCSAEFGAEQNDSVCPACCGMPGMLPVTNKKVVELGMMAGMLTNCHINRYTTFDKKSYYYPDLPASYRVVDNTIIGPLDCPLAYCVGKNKAAAEAAREKTIRAANVFRAAE